MEFKPIGIIRSPFKTRHECPAQGAFSDAEGKAIIEPEYEEALADLDGFSHAWFLYWFHKSGPFNLKVTPLMDPNLRGLFATRHPCRPNPIGLTAVRILEINGREIRFRGADMMDGTPLLDIKPLVRDFDQRADIRTGWLEKVLKRKDLKEIAGRERKL